MSAPLTAAEVQARADQAFALHNAAAPVIAAGENLGDYRRRILTALQGFNSDKVIAGISMHAVADDALPPFESLLIDKAIGAAMRSDGPLRMVTSIDDSGRKIRRFFGNPGACWGPYKAVVKRVRFNPEMGRGANAPGAVVPVGMVMSDGTTRPVR